MVSASLDTLDDGAMADETTTADAVAAALAVVPPQQFTAERAAAAAKATGDLAKLIKALRKPAVAAWAVNLLVRDGQLGKAVELSSALREAQDEVDAKALMQLGRQRRELVTSLARRAGELVRERGGNLSASAQEAVASTINAAVMDERAAAAVLTGRLVKPLEAGDLDEVDLREYVAGSLDAAAPSAPASRDDLAARRARKAAEAAEREAERAATEAERDLARIEAERTKAREQADLLHERLEDLRAQMQRAMADADGPMRRSTISTRNTRSQHPGSRRRRRKRSTRVLRSRTEDAC